MIICTTIIFKQLHYLQNADLGLNKEHLIEVDVLDWRRGADGFKQEILKNPYVKSVALGVEITNYLQGYSFEENMFRWEDENGKTNLDFETVGGNLLMISQFTLYADCKKGNRPSFIRAGAPEMANRLYQYILEKCRVEFPETQQGEFGANMQITLINDGPFTIVLDSDEIF